MNFTRLNAAKMVKMCVHLKNAGICNYYHPPNEIPCYHGRNCKYYKFGRC